MRRLDSTAARTYAELGGPAETPQGIVALFATERSLLDNGRVGADWNETRERAMVRVRSDFEAASAGASGEWVTDDLVRSAGEQAVEADPFELAGGTAVVESPGAAHQRCVTVVLP